MSLPNDSGLQKIQFYVTTPYGCGYLPKKLAQSLIAAPQHLVNASVYNGLIQQGFRRSGKFAYRPHCELCSECVPVRIVVNDFIETRSQLRAYKKHSDLEVRILPLGFHQSHFELYAEYQALRHADEKNHIKKAEQGEVEQYKQFLCQSNVESVMIEFRDKKNAIKIVSLIDIVSDGISAVYTFYDAKETQASYGTHSILWLINWTKKQNLPYLYLGYWIKASSKMAYKEKFNPQEKLIDGEWS